MQTMSRQVQLFIFVTVASTVLVVDLFADQILWNAWEQLLLFFFIVVIAFSLHMPNPGGGSVTPTAVLSYLAIYIFNPPTALLVIGAGGTIGYVVSRGWTPWRAIWNGCLMALSVAVGSSVFILLGGTSGKIDISHDYLGLVAGPLAHQATNCFIVAVAHSRWRATPFLSTWFSKIRDFFWPNLLSIASAMMLAVFYTRVHFSVILIYLVQLPLQWLALRLYFKRRQLDAQIVDGLVVATDVNFPLGRGHARRVADIAVAIAREMRLPELELESVEFAALLHDVGMIGKDDLLERPIVSPEDAKGLQDHVRVGAEIAKELPRKDIANMILRHHEKYDGTGYPNGVRGQSIPIGARIIALAEAVDSMASGAFPHPSPISSDAIVSNVTAEKGRAFDPEVVEAFLRTLEHGSIAVGMATPGKEAILRPPRLGGSPAR